jgi:hypothetical protein
MWLRPIANMGKTQDRRRTSHDNRKQIGNPWVGSVVSRPPSARLRWKKAPTVQWAYLLTVKQDTVKTGNVLHTFTFAIHIHASVDQGCLNRVGPTRSYP